jgi:hypothetical protein
VPWISNAARTTDQHAPRRHRERGSLTAGGSPASRVERLLPREILILPREDRAGSGPLPSECTGPGGPELASCRKRNRVSPMVKHEPELHITMCHKCATGSLPRGWFWKLMRAGSSR